MRGQVALETIVMILIFMAILSIAIMYIWNILNSTQKTIKSTATHASLAKFSKKLRTMLETNSFGRLVLSVPQGYNFINGFYSFAVVNTSSSRTLFVNQVSDASKVPSASILFVNSSTTYTTYANTIKDYVKNGGILIVDTSAVNVSATDLFNITPYINSTLITLPTPYYAIYTEPFYDNFHTNFLFLNVSGLGLHYVFNYTTDSLAGIRLLEYTIYNGLIYPLAMVQHYGYGCIIYSEDPTLTSYLVKNPVTDMLLCENMNFDKLAYYYWSEYRTIVNPLEKEYDYFVYTCDNIMLMSKGFSKVAVYRIPNNWTEAMNPSYQKLYYEGYYDLVTSVPVPGCGIYLVKTYAPTVPFLFSQGGAVSLAGKYLLVPMTGRLFVCGYNTSFQIIDETTGKVVDSFNFPGVFGCYPSRVTSPGLYLIKSWPREVIAYSFFGFDNNISHMADVISPPYFQDSSGNKIFIFPWLFFNYSVNVTTGAGYIINYVALITSQPNAEIKGLNIYEFGSGYKFLFPITLTTNEFMYFVPNESCVVVQAPKSVSVVLEPVFYYGNGTLNLVAPHGAVYFLDSWIFLSLVGSPGSLYNLTLYTSASAPKFDFAGYTFNLTPLTLFQQANPNSNLFTIYSTNSLFYYSNITRIIYNCTIPTNNSIFISINNSYLNTLAQDKLCLCYNSTGSFVCNTTLYPYPILQQNYTYLVTEENTLKLV